MEVTTPTSEPQRTGDKQEPYRARVLRHSPIFSGLSDSEIAELAGLASERRFSTGEFIFWEGDDPDWFFILADGKVKVIKHSASGRDFTLSFFSEGEMFGEVAVFENKPYPASAQATTETTVVAIDREHFVRFLADRPEVALRIISVLGGRLREAQTRLKDIAIERVEQRLANALLMLSARLGPTLPFTRQEIASMTGTTTETAIRVMSRLRERGIIRSTRGRVTIADPEKLRLLSEGPPHV